jgi:hypothetical protein
MEACLNRSVDSPVQASLQDASGKVRLEQTFTATDCHSPSGMKEKDLVFTDFGYCLGHRHQLSKALASLLRTGFNAGEALPAAGPIDMYSLFINRNGASRAGGDTRAAASAAIGYKPFFKNCSLRFRGGTPPA